MATERNVEQKVQRICRSLSENIGKWPGIVAIVLGEAAGIETIDPYFRVDLDVYYRDELPSRADRAARLGDPAAFEGAPGHNVDRFLIEDFPVVIFYKQTERIDRILDRVIEGHWAFRNETTNLLYRIQKGTVLHNEGSWFESAAARLEEIPEVFWERLKQASRFALDRYVNEIGAAVYRNDFVYYQVAAVHFMQSLCSFLFACNQRFEPSSQLLLDHMGDLKIVPQEFAGRFDSLIRPDIEITPERRHEIAQLISKSIRYM
jgi:hypothetical protein